MFTSTQIIEVACQESWWKERAVPDGVIFMLLWKSDLAIETHDSMCIVKMHTSKDVYFPWCQNKTLIGITHVNTGCIRWRYKMFRYNSNIRSLKWSDHQMCYETYHCNQKYLSTLDVLWNISPSAASGNICHPDLSNQITFINLTFV